MTSPALQIALAHHYAWTGRDLAAAMTYLADDVVLDAPAGRLVGRAAYREFLEPFAGRLLIRAELIAAFGDDTTALLMYDTETIAATSAPAAECVRVRDGRIVYNRFVFDRTPFTEFRRRPAAGVAPRTGDVTPRTGDVAARTGNIGPRTGNIARRTSDVTRRTGDIARQGDDSIGHARDDGAARGTGQADDDRAARNDVPARNDRNAGGVGQVGDDPQAGDDRRREGDDRRRREGDGDGVR